MEQLRIYTLLLGIRIPQEDMHQFTLTNQVIDDILTQNIVAI